MRTGAAAATPQLGFEPEPAVDPIRIAKTATRLVPVVATVSELPRA